MQDAIVAQWVKILITELDDLSFSSRTYSVEKKKKLSSGLHVHTMAKAHTNMPTSQIPLTHREKHAFKKEDRSWLSIFFKEI